MSWFFKIRELCYKYNLPHPLTLLDKPQNKSAFKTLIKTNIQQYWQNFLRERVKTLPSLRYFNPHFMSLSQPHPILSTTPNPYEVNKMTVQLRMLSGRYRVGSLTRHFSEENSGICELCGTELENLPHLLVPRCPQLLDRRQTLLDFALGLAEQSPLCLPLLQSAMSGGDKA